MKRLFLLFCLSIICVSCYKEVDITTLKMTSSVTPDFYTATILVTSNLQSNYLNYRVYVSENASMTQNVKVFNMVSQGIAGYYKGRITELEEGKKYYYQVECYSSISSKLGSIASFSTKPVILPNLSTNPISNISATIAMGGVTVTLEGSSAVIARGLCWSTSPNPTISNTHNQVAVVGVGTCRVYMPDLTPGTNYYVRAYATNGQGTAYGAQQTFTTSTTHTDTYVVNLFEIVDFKMCFVEGGTFSMGATSEQGSIASSDERPVHSVTLSDFYIGETEVTQQLWNLVWSGNQTGNTLPVPEVSYDDAQNFICWLDSLTGLNFRLPTEAEWEYAARGGKNSQGYKYAGSNNLSQVAWYNTNSVYTVGRKLANELGLYDMSGNVWEWCQDWYGSYSSSSQTNPRGPNSGSYHVLRGGDCLSYDWECRVSKRASDGNVRTSGLRLVLPLD